MTTNSLSIDVYKKYWYHYNCQLESQICSIEDHDLLVTYLKEYIVNCCTQLQKCKWTEKELDHFKYYLYDRVYDNLTSNLKLFVEENLAVKSEDSNKSIVNILNQSVKEIKEDFPFKTEVVMFLIKKCDVTQDIEKRIDKLIDNHLAHLADEVHVKDFHGQEMIDIRKEIIRSEEPEKPKQCCHQKAPLKLVHRKKSTSSVVGEEMMVQQSSKEHSGKSFTKHNKSTNSHMNINSQTSQVKFYPQKASSEEESSAYRFDIPPPPQVLTVQKERPIGNTPYIPNEFMKDVLLKVQNDLKIDSKQPRILKEEERSVTKKDPLLIVTEDEVNLNNPSNSGTSGNTESTSTGNDNNLEIDSILNLEDTYSVFHNDMDLNGSFIPEDQITSDGICSESSAFSTGEQHLGYVKDNPDPEEQCHNNSSINPGISTFRTVHHLRPHNTYEGISNPQKYFGEETHATNSQSVYYY